MANEEHLAILKQGVKEWNVWREKNLTITPNLRGADLNSVDLVNANLLGVDLAKANLVGADLSYSNLFGANLYSASLAHASTFGANLAAANLKAVNFFFAQMSKSNLNKSNLFGANLSKAIIIEADVTAADLSFANFTSSDITYANFSMAGLRETVLADVDLSRCKGLETCWHLGPSIVDHRTLQRSGPLPLAFLRGIGLSDTLIDCLPSILNQAVQMCSCFISYSSRDERFAQRLYADLQSKGVRCWFAPHDMPIGAKILDTIDEAIRLRDKVLLILSKPAIASDWVEDEVTAAFEEERRRGQIMLFPIRLDDTVMKTKEAWAAKLRARHIGDFIRWKEHDTYEKALKRLLLDLQIEKTS
jgi:hypothetical protein